MESSPQNSPAPSTGEPGLVLASSRRRSSFLIALSLLGLLGLATGGYFFICAGDGNDGPNDKDAPPPQFVKWDNPALCIVISGQMHGYLQPCGCSSPQIGGLVRLYNFMQTLHDKKWPIVALDVGEQAETNGPQAKLKYEYTMRARQLMKYNAVGLGRTEFNTPLFEALARFSLENPSPTPLASNIMKVDKDNPKDKMFYDMNVHRFKIIDAAGPKAPKLAVYSIVEATMQKEVKDPDVKFLPASKELAALLKATEKAKALNVLLFQGTENDPDLPKLLKNNPSVAIVICLSSDPEPPARAIKIEQAQVFTVGHKGKYVGVIGLFKKEKNFELKYELVSMGPKYDTPKGKEAGHPLMTLMEKYTATVRDQKFQAMFPRGAHSLEVQLNAMGVKTEYIGSDACIKCHAQEHNVWDNSKHSHAYDALVEAKNPKLRQFDGECLACHTVGFQHNTGFDGDLAAPNMQPNPKQKLNESLKHVGCESCHGPASAHVKNSKNVALYPLMNPLSTQRIPPEMAAAPALVQAFKAKQLRRQDDFCQRCHDPENDVHWGNQPFAAKWKMIDHIFPNAVRQANQRIVGKGPPQGVGVGAGDKKGAEK